jgi:catechol 2,3-dioxygenase-like lactoylglutathione lyase family enzyme
VTSVAHGIQGHRQRRRPDARIAYVGHMRVIGFDHVVMICHDIEASLGFYEGVLGLDALDLDEWRNGDALFPSVRVNQQTIIDLLPGEPDGRNTDHICLVIEPTDLHKLVERKDLNVVNGPVQRGGACGMGWSIYVLDPDGHLIELKQYDADATGTTNAG